VRLRAAPHAGKRTEQVAGNNVDNQEHNTANPGTASMPEAQQAGAGPANPARRRFARLGAGTSGVILTLASGSGMAQVVCATPSGSLSLGVSSHQPAGGTSCSGVSPGYWKQDQHTWPIINTTSLKSKSSVSITTDQQQRDTLYSVVFPNGNTTLYRTGTMQQVLDNNDPAADPYNLGMHLVAAYLNVMSGRISFLTAQTLKNMWYDVITYGHYAPSAGVSWTAEQVKTYLQRTEY
jgi:hypothetical protein